MRVLQFSVANLTILLFVYMYTIYALYGHWLNRLFLLSVCLSRKSSTYTISIYFASSTIWILQCAQNRTERSHSFSQTPKLQFFLDKLSAVAHPLFSQLFCDRSLINQATNQYVYFEVWAFGNHVKMNSFYANKAKKNLIEGESNRIAIM